MRQRRIQRRLRRRLLGRRTALLRQRRSSGAAGTEGDPTAFGDRDEATDVYERSAGTTTPGLGWASRRIGGLQRQRRIPGAAARRLRERRRRLLHHRRAADRRRRRRRRRRLRALADRPRCWSPAATTQCWKGNWRRRRRPSKAPTHISGRLDRAEGLRLRAGGEASIKLYATADCGGEPVATGSSAELRSTGPGGQRRRRLDHDLPRDRRSRRLHLALLGQRRLQAAERGRPPAEAAVGEAARRRRRRPAAGSRARVSSSRIPLLVPKTRITFGPAFKTRVRRPVFRFADPTGQAGTQLRLQARPPPLAALRLAGQAAQAAPRQARLPRQGHQRQRVAEAQAEQARLQAGPGGARGAGTRATRGGGSGELRPASIRKRDREAGLTLIELLVAAAMSVILVGAAGAMLISAVRNQPKLSKKTQNVTTARYVLERMTREIRNGIVVYSATGSKVAFKTRVRRSACGGGVRGRPCVPGDRMPRHLRVHDHRLHAQAETEPEAPAAPVRRRRSSPAWPATKSSTTNTAPEPKKRGRATSASPCTSPTPKATAT